MSVNVVRVRNMSDRVLVDNAWDLLTNVRACRGGSVKGRKLAQRRLRAMGVRFYLALHNGDPGDTGWNDWGFRLPGEGMPVVEGLLVTGVTLNHCAAKLGNGCAKRGWEIYWSHR